MVEEVLVEALEVILMVVSMVVALVVSEVVHQALLLKMVQLDLYGQVIKDNFHQHVQQTSNYEHNN